MKSKERWLGLGAVALLSSAVAGSAYAGYKTESAYCKKLKDGSGYCYGTFRGFRNNVDAGASAHFERDAYNNGYFSAFLGGGVYQCAAPAGWIGQDLFNRALTASGWFSVNWDATGQCTNIGLGQDSAFREF